MQEPQEDSNESLWSSNGFPQVASRATFTYFKTEDGTYNKSQCYGSLRTACGYSGHCKQASSSGGDAERT